MRKTTDTFSFAIPESWKTFVESGRFVAEGSNGQHIVLSSWTPQLRAGSRPEPSVFETLLDALVENAKQAAMHAADDPALSVTKPMSAAAPAGGVFNCWTLLADDGEVFFGAAVVRGPSAVMLVTYELPLSSESIAQFEEFLSSFGPPIDGECHA